ncbi:MAG: ComEA family DNA-binding protein, partial [Anaerolineales bacterium]|nr:ComEA family DNA-binding protein [Anaerolineales bacterium]
AELPGVYLLPCGSIVQDALDAAGGPTSSADLDRINLADDLEDGQRVYIPQVTASGSTVGEQVLPSEIDPDLMININTAGASELELLPGIGPSLAKEIIDHRSANGLFNTVDDLLDVSGIGPAKVEQIQGLITFQSPRSDMRAQTWQASSPAMPDLLRSRNKFEKPTCLLSPAFQKGSSVR